MLYFDCKMGVAGDMVTAALYDLMNPSQKDRYLKEMNLLFPGIIELTPVPDEKLGVSGTHMHVKINGLEETPDFHGSPCGNHHHEGERNQDDCHHHEHGHRHYSYQDICNKIDAFSLANEIKQDIAAIYRIIGDAEAKVHGTDLDNIHFHEVGSMDAICDVAGAAIGLSILGENEIASSPIHVGNGTVRCAHGILPVPAPATREILGGIPYYKGQLETELCTPTGAAILKYYVKQWKDLEADSHFQKNIIKIGVGTGSKNLPQPNVLRVYRMNSFPLKEEETKKDLDRNDTEDQICQLTCNIDDMTGEEIGYAMERLLEQGALDVYYQPIAMKKNRPGVMLNLICPADQKDKFSPLILKYTSTRGLRYEYFQRHKLESVFLTIDTPLGQVRKKISTGTDVYKEKYEYQDVVQIAKALDTSYREAERYIRQFDTDQK